MVKKQYYIPGKEYEWTEWSRVSHPKEILSVDDLEAGREYILSMGLNDDRNIIYWGKNAEVIFITELLYHTYGHIFIKDILHLRNTPEKTWEEKLSEKYSVSLDTIKRMMDDGLIEEEE